MSNPSLSAAQTGDSSDTIFPCLGEVHALKDMNVLRVTCYVERDETWRNPTPFTDATGISRSQQKRTLMSRGKMINV